VSSPKNFDLSQLTRVLLH